MLRLDKSKPGKCLWPMIGLFYATIIAIFWLWSKSFEPGKIKEHLEWLSPHFLEAIFLLMIVGLVFNYRDLRQALAHIPRPTWLALLFLCLAGLICSAFLPPRTHRIYYDEDIYLHIGQNIAWEGKAAMCVEGHIEYGQYQSVRREYNKEPNGWPYLVSLVFRFFGVNELYGHFLNNLFYGLGILTIFLIAALWFEDWRPGFFSALIFGLIPQNMVWSNTASAEFPSALLAGLAVLATVFYLKKKTLSSLFLLVVTLAYAIQMRPESFLVIPVVGFMLITTDRGLWKRASTYGAIALFLFLILPHLMHLWTVKGHSWDNPSGKKFSLSHFLHNSKTNSLYYLTNKRFPVFFTLLFFLSLLLPKLWLQRYAILLWFLLFWGVFLFFYAGSYTYGANVRFSLLSNMPLSLLAGLGASTIVQWLKRIYPRPRYVYTFFLLFLLFTFVSFLPSVRAVTPEGWGARADHNYAREMAKLLPEDAIVLTHNPNMFLLWGKSAAQSFLANDKPYLNYFFQRFSDGVYFHYNYWCNLECSDQNAICDTILKDYKTIVVKAYKERNYRYVLYKLKQKEASLVKPKN